jgi:hypothetical protein
MRWSYKTVHYERKKEGLLGGAFLDESEVELSLNEYGKAGWELVAMVDTADGLIAVFKQPISIATGLRQRPQAEPLSSQGELYPVKRVETEQTAGEVALLDEYEVEQSLEENGAADGRSAPPAGTAGEGDRARRPRSSANADIGAIKIE